MLRWTRAWSLPLRGLGPCCLSSSRVPVAPSSSGRSGVEPRSVLLSYKLLDGEATRPALVFLHGLFGSKTNFNSIAKALAHQTGRRPELVERLIAVDISPVETTPSSSFPSYMAAMRAVDIPDEVPRSSARKLADEQLSTVIQDMAERQFLLTNLVEVDGRFVWRVNLEALAQHVDKILAFPPRPESYPGPTLFLLGGNSQYVRPSHHAEIRRLFPQAQMQTVPNAGHWIHADCPQDFVAAIRGFLA
ncbi:protein ABHD11 isoform X2 [Leptonychotes weddellii]|uniref:sn-1-specific diacylglycerol lipase ABHD11 n=1 Tax=Leptonychotes weddellii TaxID=9713 RepID=A0A7F8RRG8_LEPWE|nr:protein ABHD11 isoform X2 [Leptonychotes weddellii]